MISNIKNGATSLLNRKWQTGYVRWAFMYYHWHQQLQGRDWKLFWPGPKNQWTQSCSEQKTSQLQTKFFSFKFWCKIF